MIRSTGVAIAVGLVVALPGCSTPTEPATPATATAGAAAATCDPIETPPLQLSSHLIGDAEPPSPYSSVPPTSGWHTSSVPMPGRATTGLRDAEIVSALENGIVVAAVDPAALDQADPSVVADLLAQFPDRLIVAPYEPAMASEVALLTWGRLQRCTELDPAAVTSFVLVERVSPDQH